jgi:hypothetical protein
MVKLLDLLKGKKISVITDMLVEVELTVESVTSRTEQVDLEPSGPSNDWWPASEERTFYDFTFTNGAKKTYTNIDDIKISVKELL